MTDKEMILTVSRIAQEFCNVLPQEAVLFFAEGLRRRHNSIPDATQAIWTRWPTLCSRSISIRRGTADLRFASSEAARPDQSGSTERQRRQAKKENGRPLQGRAR
jgi:hypothetical protein